MARIDPGRLARQWDAEWAREVRQVALDEERADDVGSTFAVVKDFASPQPPLLIVVHPGDAVPYLTPDLEDTTREAFLQVARTAQPGMAAEIFARLDAGHDVLVLHRQLSIPAIFEGNLDGTTGSVIDSSYAAAIARASAAGAVLYGDHLVAVAEWLLDRGMATRRPEIFLTGAYCDTGTGCVTFLGQALERNTHAKVLLSPHSISADDNSAPRWLPQSEGGLGLGGAVRRSAP